MGIGNIIKAGFIIVIIYLIAVFALPSCSTNDDGHLVTASSLKKIVNVSDLSTFESVYNGIAKVKNSKSKKIDYYVSYEAKVKAGIDFSEVKIDVNNEKKVITVTLPNVKIEDPEVDIKSLDYMFINEDANTNFVSAQAYKECKKDAEKESLSASSILELAEQNAKNVIEALIKPFADQLDEDYDLVFE